jgi:hypothetical protein
LQPGSPPGRQFLVGYLGCGHGHTPFEQLGQVPGSAPLTGAGIRRRAARRHRRWQDGARHEAARLSPLPKRGTNGAGLLDVDEAGLLADRRAAPFSFGYGGSDDAMRALTALARQRLPWSRPSGTACGQHALMTPDS